MNKPHTHYIPAFTRVDAHGRQQTACREYVGPAEVALLGHTPTCWGCALWLHEVEHPWQHREAADRARVLAKITAETPWGDPLEAA